MPGLCDLNTEKAPSRKSHPLTRRVSSREATAIFDAFRNTLVTATAKSTGAVLIAALIGTGTAAAQNISTVAVKNVGKVKLKVVIVDTTPKRKELGHSPDYMTGSFSINLKPSVSEYHWEVFLPGTQQPCDVGHNIKVSSITVPSSASRCALAGESSITKSITDGVSSGIGFAKQQIDNIRIAAGRVSYATTAAANAKNISEQYQSGQITAEAAEDAAVKARRQLEAQTRARLPGPEPAKTLNETAEARNIAKYGDPLGVKDPAQLRELKPNVTTERIIASSGRTNGIVNAGGVVVGAASVVGTLITIQELRNAFAGEVPVTLKGKDPGDYEVDDEFKITVQEGGNVCEATVRVHRNIIFRKKFYVVKLQCLA